MELHTDDRELATQQLKQKYFKGLISTATKTGSKYFTTNKGFKLGDSKQKAFGIYGAPDKMSTENGVEALEWNFTGDLLYDNKTDLKGKPLAKENYGHQIIMMFRRNKLIAVVLHNDIP